ncbi:tetratricopeptide repeat protein [Hyphomicrobium sp.]|uniref:tetratricopeptide repeat protein n=1 Tax=Hyphomicrobium sp. TaxID=82 RepID=UPI002E348D6D|nr:tetratricopeptide repeat protein [Hyphomicrobium sp.]HEX2840876.1 tetratricopeptide repeat protein [Hyphomicrobium sp.]
MMGADVRIDDDFELAVAEGMAFKTLYVRVEDAETGHSEISADALRKEAVTGSVDAQIGWARRLLHGHGVERDREAAFRWFTIAARSGDPEALNMVGRCYELGWGVPLDLHEAAEWFGKAAAKGHAWAEFNLASLYAQGRGVPHNEKKAVTLLVRSARRGNPKAMNMLGRFREGSDVPRRRVRSAALWSRWAAERGCFRGQFHHGRFLVAAGRIGDGIHWFRTSLAHAPADFRREALNVLGTHDHPELRAFVLREMSGEQGGSK